MADQSFFERQREQSRVKSDIVSKYFLRWAEVMLNIQDRSPHPEHNITYLDLFSGPGVFGRGEPSTPVLVLQSAIADARLRFRLLTLFNDADPDLVAALDEALRALLGYDTLSNTPQLFNREVDERSLREIMAQRIGPTFSFVDPFGYKGLSLDLIERVTREFGCDCVFFFNYQGVNRAISNPAVGDLVDALFGPERAVELRPRLLALSPDEREVTIIEELSQAIQSINRDQPRYVLPFRFRKEDGTRTSHHLIFVSKGFRGYELMREVMAEQSSMHTQGVASLEYNPADALKEQEQPLLFNLRLSRTDLIQMLLTDFAGQTIKAREVYRTHNEGRPFTEVNYYAALTHMELQRQITANPAASKRRTGKGATKGHITGETVISFPAR